MLTFQDIYEEIQDLTGDSSTTATTIHKRRLNDTYKLLLSKYNKRAETTATTIASQQSYELPHNFKKLSSVKVTVSSIDYPLIQIYNENDWNIINDQGTAYTSDIQTHFYIKDNNILLYPTPASDNNTITYYYTLTDKDLSADNYTTGTITTLPYTIDFTVAPAEDDTSGTLAAAWSLPTGVYQVVFDNGDVRNVTLTITKTTATWTDELLSDCSDVTVTVNNLNGGSILIASGSTFTAAMIGRYIKIDDDGYWYKIYSYLSATAITLEKEYAGTAITSGSETYTIAEIPLIPEEYHSALIYRPCYLYFMGKRDAQGLVNQYKLEYEQIYNRIKPEDDDDVSRVITNDGYTLKNPADYPRV